MDDSEELFPTILANSAVIILPYFILSVYCGIRADIKRQPINWGRITNNEKHQRLSEKRKASAGTIRAAGSPLKRPRICNALHLLVRIKPTNQKC